MKPLLLFALAATLHPSVVVRDIDGLSREPFKVDKGRVEAVFFVTNDCPISNYYAHEIRRICDEYATRGAGCTLVYTDPSITDEQARQHSAEYGHGSYPKIVDRTHALVKAAGARVNPTAVLVTANGRIAYRGRIDNTYASIGVQRRVVTVHDLREALDAVIAGRPVAKPETQPIGCYIQ